MIRLSVNGTDRTTRLDDGSLVIVDQIQNKANTCNFTMMPATYDAPEENQEVIVYDAVRLVSASGTAVVVYDDLASGISILDRGKFRAGQYFWLGIGAAGEERVTISAIAEGSSGQVNVTLSSAMLNAHSANEWCGRKIFAGTVTSVRSSNPRMLTDVEHQVSCTDFTKLFDRKLINDSWADVDARYVVNDALDTTINYNAELDELVSLLRDGKALILGLETRERTRTGIGNLKVGFNKIFGYYIEISRGQLAHVPDDFIRKQTLVNAERFITQELKEFEEKVTGAQDRRLELEYRLFAAIRATMAEASSRILHTAGYLARIDFFCCLAEAAQKYRYTKPVINAGEAIIIKEGRHPVIERALPPGRFVPNDIHLDQESEEVLIITGPNMAGKSTVLRQTALITLMAQMGGFVPAAAAEIGVVDRIFTRVGASDNLRRGQSTFMVEMNETANILNNATERSLVILDEIGRGTSTFDGLSIAWAVAEELVNKNGRGVKTIFATHYHELTELAATNNRVKNYNIAVREWNDTIIFLHKLLPGGTNRSYGIQVAALAGVPAKVVARAKELLHNIEQGEFNRQGEPRIATSPRKKKGRQPGQLSLFNEGASPAARRLREINPDVLSPREALDLLYELKRLTDVE